MQRASLRCPACGSSIGYDTLNIAEPFRCPACQEHLRVPNYYNQAMLWGTMVTSLVLAATFGLRGLALVVATAILWVVVGFVALLVIKRVLPPKIELHRTGIPTIFGH